MEPSAILQFTKSDEISVSSLRTATVGSLVVIHQSSGSLSFNFHMTPEQARELAAALIAHADDVEGK